MWKVIAAIGAFLLAVAVPMGATLLIAVLVEQSTVPLLILSSLSIMALTLTPILAGSIVALTPIDPKLPEGSRSFRRLGIIFGGTQILGVAGIVAFAMIQGASWWLPAIIIAAGVLLAAVCGLVGESFRRREVASPRMSKPVRAMTREERNRKVRSVAITFAFTLVVASAALIALMYAIPDDDDDDDQAGILATALTFGVSFAFLAASIACLVVCWPLVRSLRDQLGPNPQDHRLIKRVVIRGKTDSLNAEQSERAAQYAVVYSDFFPFQTAQALLLYVALFLQQGMILISNPDSELRGLTIGIVVFLLAGIAVYLPMALRQVGQVRRFAAEHRDLIRVSPTGTADDG